VSTDAGLTQVILIIEYDGTNYCGFQCQVNRPTIQAELELALKKLTGEKIRIRGASRTDTGVHAEGQVASFKTVSVLPPNTFVEGLNHYLPEDIAIKSARVAQTEIDVRRSAVSREYCYSINNSSTRSPLRQRFSHQVVVPLDVEAMSGASKELKGTHDFAAFASNVEDGKATVRRVYRVDLEKKDGLLNFNMTANAFLPHQIRNTVGSLLKVGTGKMNISEFCDMMKSKLPGTAGPMVPACGLCLKRINYS
jgi:tRNA pseudouridine38-40 synthase